MLPAGEKMAVNIKCYT